MQKIESVQTTIGVATSNNTPETIVKRDANGDFAAGTVKATSLEVSGSTKITMPLKDSTGADIINLGLNAKYGSNVMPALTTGTSNLGIGEGIMPNATTANSNTFIGYGVAKSSGAGYSWNTGVGMECLSAVAGNNNTAVGHNAGRLISSGGDNTCVGVNAAHGIGTLTTGSQNTAIGKDTRVSGAGATNCTAIGYQAYADTNNTVQLGNTAVVAVKTSGTLYSAGLESIGTTLTIAGLNNTSVVNLGSGTGVQEINLGNNGAGATAINIGGGSDVVKVNLPIKDSAGANIINLPTSNCMIGKNVFSNLQATNAACTGFGVNIGYSNAEGLSHNTFVGSDIAQNAAGVYAYCAAVGSGALKNVNAFNNTAMGYNSLSELTTGLNNVGFGTRAGSAHTAVTTGTGNTFIGATAGSDNANRVNGTAIGQNARVDFDNCVQLCNTGRAVSRDRVCDERAGTSG